MIENTVLTLSETVFFRRTSACCMLCRTPCQRCGFNYTNESLNCIKRTGRRLCIDAVPVDVVVHAAERILDDSVGAGGERELCGRH